MTPRWLRVARDYPRRVELGHTIPAPWRRLGRWRCWSAGEGPASPSWCTRTAQHRRQYRYLPPGGAR